VYALWVFAIIGHAFLFREAWVGTLNERDFAALWVAGKLAASGHASTAFDTEAIRAAGKVISNTKLIKLAYPYPPHGLFVAVPLSYLPLNVAFVVWQAISGALFYVAARPYLPKGFPKFLALLTPAALINILFGQVGLFLGALWLFAFSGSAIASAVLTFKPHLGALAGVEVIRRRQIIRTVIIFLILVAASSAAFGLDSWRAWIMGSASHQIGDLTVRPFGIWRFQMVTPYLAYGLLGWFLFAAAAIMLLASRFDAFTAATGSFLIAPYGFHYDMTVVCLGFGLLLFQKWREIPAWQVFICAIAFLLPLVIALGTWIASPILLVGLFVQTQNPITKEGFDPLSLWRQQFGSHRLNS
jgi:hypothetical protein